MLGILLPTLLSWLTMSVMRCACSLSLPSCLSLQLLHTPSHPLHLPLHCRAYSNGLGQREAKSDQRARGQAFILRASPAGHFVLAMRRQRSYRRSFQGGEPLLPLSWEPLTSPARLPARFLWFPKPIHTALISPFINKPPSGHPHLSRPSVSRSESGHARERISVSALRRQAVPTPRRTRRTTLSDPERGPRAVRAAPAPWHNASPRRQRLGGASGPAAEAEVPPLPAAPGFP